MSVCTVFIIIIMTIASLICATIIRHESVSYAYFSIVLDGLADTGAVLKSFTLKTRRQCVLECVSFLACSSVNYKLSGGGNCELLQRTLKGSKSLLTARPGWVYMTTNDKDSDIGPTCKLLSPCQNGGICSEMPTGTSAGFKCTCGQLHSGKYCENDRDFASCKAVYDAGFRNDGIYKLTNMGYHYCFLTSLTKCGAGGWTLALKTRGRKKTFQYSSKYWTTSNLYNHVYSLQVGLIDQEAKFDAYNKLAFKKICIGMTQGATTKYLLISPVNIPSLYYLMCRDFVRTSLTRSEWIGLVSGSYLQQLCNRQGFNNNVAMSKKVRIGIFGNEQNNCDSIDSVIGIGIDGSFSQDVNIITGADFNIEGNTTRVATNGLILIQ
eukprot:gene14185-15663_t